MMRSVAALLLGATLVLTCSAGPTDPPRAGLALLDNYLQYVEGPNGPNGKKNKVELATTTELRDMQLGASGARKLSDSILDGELRAAKALDKWCKTYAARGYESREADDPRNKPTDKYGSWNLQFEPIEQYNQPMCLCHGTFPVTWYGQNYKIKCIWDYGWWPTRGDEHTKGQKKGQLIARREIGADPRSGEVSPDASFKKLFTEFGALAYVPPAEVTWERPIGEQDSGAFVEAAPATGADRVTVLDLFYPFRPNVLADAAWSYPMLTFPHLKSLKIRTTSTYFSGNGPVWTEGRLAPPSDWLSNMPSMNFLELEIPLAGIQGRQSYIKYDYSMKAPANPTVPSSTVPWPAAWRPFSTMPQLLELRIINPNVNSLPGDLLSSNLQLTRLEIRSRQPVALNASLFQRQSGQPARAAFEEIVFRFPMEFSATDPVDDSRNYALHPPASLMAGVRVKRLVLAGCGLTKIPDFVFKIIGLEELDLADNNLHSFALTSGAPAVRDQADYTAEMTTDLKKRVEQGIDVVSIFGDYFRSKNTLRQINLRRNLISNIPVDVFAPLDHLDDVDIQSQYVSDFMQARDERRVQNKMEEKFPPVWLDVRDDTFRPYYHHYNLLTGLLTADSCKQVRGSDAQPRTVSRRGNVSPHYFCVTPAPPPSKVPEPVVPPKKCIKMELPLGVSPIEDDDARFEDEDDDFEATNPRNMALDELVGASEGLPWTQWLYSVRTTGTKKGDPGKSFVGAGVAWLCSNFSRITATELESNPGTLRAPADDSGFFEDVAERHEFDAQAKVLSVTLDEVPNNFDWSTLRGSPWSEVRELRIINSPELKDIPSTAFDHMPWLTAFHCKGTGITSVRQGTFKRNRVLSAVVINDNKALAKIEEGFLSESDDIDGPFAWPLGMHYHTSVWNDLSNGVDKLLQRPGEVRPNRTLFDKMESPLESLAVLDLQNNAIDDAGMPSRTLYKLSLIHLLDLSGNKHTALPFGLRDALVPRPFTRVVSAADFSYAPPKKPDAPWRPVYIYPGVYSFPSGGNTQPYLGDQRDPAAQYDRYPEFTATEVCLPPRQMNNVTGMCECQGTRAGEFTFPGEYDHLNHLCSPAACPPGSREQPDPTDPNRKVCVCTGKHMKMVYKGAKGVCVCNDAYPRFDVNMKGCSCPSELHYLNESNKEVTVNTYKRSDGDCVCPAFLVGNGKPGEPSGGTECRCRADANGWRREFIKTKDAAPASVTYSSKKGVETKMETSRTFLEGYCGCGGGMGVDESLQRPKLCTKVTTKWEVDPNGVKKKVNTCGAKSEHSIENDILIMSHNQQGAADATDVGGRCSCPHWSGEASRTGHSATTELSGMSGGRTCPYTAFDSIEDGRPGLLLDWAYHAVDMLTKKPAVEFGYKPIRRGQNVIGQQVPYQVEFYEEEQRPKNLREVWRIERNQACIVVKNSILHTTRAFQANQAGGTDEAKAKAKGASSTKKLPPKTVAEITISDDEIPRLRKQDIIPWIPCKEDKNPAVGPQVPDVSDLSENVAKAKKVKRRVVKSKALLFTRVKSSLRGRGHHGGSPMEASL